MKTITRVEVLEGARLRLFYQDDSEPIVVDFQPLLERGGVFTQLGDPHYFSQVSVGGRGRFITWPGEVDFCADALWEQASQHHQEIAS